VHFNFAQKVHYEQSLTTYLWAMVFNITRASQKESYKNISLFRVMSQKQEFLAFVEKQTTKSLVKNNPKTPDLLPKPIRREFSDKLSYWKYQFDGTF
jgi:hypothetical protein